MSALAPQIAPYYPSLMALLILCFAIFVQSFIAGTIGLGRSQEVPGMPLKGNHGDLSFRTLRTYQNSVENLPAFIAVLGLAIIAGASALWVNWLAALHVALRLAYWAIYYGGIGKVQAGPRTIVFVLAFFANVVLAIVALIALI
jgi:uncharacterized MAPEG superfamily protein